MLNNATKTHQQVYYNGIVDCIRKIIKNEGVFSLYKGILPLILVETPKGAVKFFTFEQYKRFFMFGSGKATPLTYSLAGFGAGVTEALLVNPFEMVKVTLQANRSLANVAPSTWSVAKQIAKESGFGLNGLNKGLTATIGRHSVYLTFYFGFYHSTKDIVPESSNATLEFLRKLTLGTVAGTLGTVCNIPFDVAKSRIQGPQPVKGEVKYSATMNTIATVYKEEGFRALYKGFAPKVLRLGPGGAILLLVYDRVYQSLSRLTEEL